MVKVMGHTNKILTVVVDGLVSEFCLTPGCKENVLGHFLALDITQMLVTCLQELTEWLKTTGIYSPTVLEGQKTEVKLKE